MEAERSTFGQYTVLAPLGDDSMLVQRAAEAGFARLLVIRSLSNGAATVDVEQTLASAKLAARLQHPNVRQIHEVGKLDGTPYIAFEYLEGIRFDQLLIARRRGDALSDPRLYCALLAQGCEGLHQAHRSRAPGKTTGLLHGCLRPERVFVTSGGTVKLLGFGLRNVHNTPSGDEMSQPEHYAYMAPEQVLGRQSDPRTDVFSMGVLAWEALTSRRLFARANRVEVLRAITQNPIPPPSALVPTIPPKLNHVVVRALARNPAERFQSAREFGVALEEGVSAIGSPLSTVAIAANIDRYFATELEEQRSIILKARRELEAALADDEFEVPTRLFGGDTDIDALAKETKKPEVTVAGHSRAKSETAPATPRSKTASGGAQFARPPDTLSDVTEGALDDVSLDPSPLDPAPAEPPILGDNLAAMIEEVAGGTPAAGFAPLTEKPPGEQANDPTGTSQVNAPPRRRIWLTILLILILAGAGAAAGYGYWLDQQAATK